MAWVITRLCRDCLDLACVEACPVNCIFEYAGPDRDGFPNQLYIDPEACIDCGMCEPECPWEAIFSDTAVPHVFSDDIALNLEAARDESAIRIPKVVAHPAPTPEAILANLEKWRYRG
jgi:ferredoxin